MTTEARGLCPICFQNGIKYGGDAQGLVGHLETDHTIKNVIHQLAAAALTMHPGPKREQPTCSAHGETDCEWCSLNSADCINGYGQCSYYSETGMHWDTCPNRIRGPKDLMKRITRVDVNGDVFYQFAPMEGMQ